MTYSIVYSQIRLLMIYAIARGMDDITRQRLFNLSELGMEYFNIIQNLVMLGVSLSRVCIKIYGKNGIHNIRYQIVSIQSLFIYYDDLKE